MTYSEPMDVEHNGGEIEKQTHRSRSWMHWANRLPNGMGIETRGIVPVPPEERTDTQYSKIFFIWFTANFNILSFSAGTLGPVVFGLGLRDSCLVILFFVLFCALAPAYFTTWGPRLGLRQMVQARFSFGYYGVIIPCIFNLMGMFGFSILNAILGGQALASVAGGQLSWAVGIVIIAVCSLLLSFCGYTVLNWYERVAWFPVLVTFLISIGVSAKHLSPYASPSGSSEAPIPYTEPATAVAVLSFGSAIAGFVITYSSLSSDFTSYFRPDAKAWKIFAWSYAGLVLPIVSLQCLGAAVAVAATSPLTNAPSSWESGYENGDVGGLLLATLLPVGTRFAKFLTVLLSMSVIGNMGMTFYSISLNFQVFLPWLWVVPRAVFSIAATAIVIPLAIVGSKRFYHTLSNFLGLIGYWAGAFIAIILIEHFYFRRGDFTKYNIRNWDQSRLLPWGVAALGAGVCAFGVVVPCMEQVWFTGPIGKNTGDIGFEVAFAAAGILYVPFRTLEMKIRGV